MGKKFFAVDAVIGQISQVLDVKAGSLEMIEDATWPLADRRTNIALDMKEPADILVIGLPRNFHYGPGMGTNPILMSLAIGGQLARCGYVFREGGVIIAASICDGWFNENWFPSYPETYDALQEYCYCRGIPGLRGCAEGSRPKTEYLFKYSNYYTYHPFHAMSMISGGSVPQLWTSGVFHCGPESAGVREGHGIHSCQHLRGGDGEGQEDRGNESQDPLHSGVFLPAVCPFTFDLSHRAEECANG